MNTDEFEYAAFEKELAPAKEEPGAVDEEATAWINSIADDGWQLLKVATKEGLHRLVCKRERDPEKRQKYEYKILFMPKGTLPPGKAG